MGAGNEPLFSVLITSYDRPECISRCIESVLANEGEDFELIISDDASPKAEAIAVAVNPYLSRSNVQFHQQQTNIGEPENRNFLVSRAAGRYNIILCDDDSLLPHTLRTLRSYIHEAPEHDLYTFGYKVVSESGARCYDRVAPKMLTINLTKPMVVRQMLEATWLPFLLFHQSTFCCKRGVEKEIPYRGDVAPADDYMFLLESICKGKRIYVVPECLMSYQWLQSYDKTAQVNQSSDIVKVMKASAIVYYDFQRRTDLDAPVPALIEGDTYRRRFLYDTIIRRMRLTETNIADLNLHPIHREELASYIATNSKYVVLLKTMVKMTYELMWHFSIRGILYSFRVCVAYFKFRVLHAGLITFRRTFRGPASGSPYTGLAQ